MSKLPIDVESIREYLELYPEHKFTEVANKLTANTPDLSNMWKALEKRKEGDDNQWVWAFLETAESCRNLPAFHYKTPNERSELSAEITKLAGKLSVKLISNGLDSHIVYNNGKLFNGFFIYEDFSESNRERIDLDGTTKLKISEFLVNIANRAKEKISKEPLSGKISKNAEAVRFARLLSERNKMLYDQPLNKVIATATNTLFDTNYSESDIANLRNR